MSPRNDGGTRGQETFETGGDAGGTNEGGGGEETGGAVWESEC